MAFPSATMADIIGGTYFGVVSGDALRFRRCFGDVSARGKLEAAPMAPMPRLILAQ